MEDLLLVAFFTTLDNFFARIFVEERRFLPLNKEQLLGLAIQLSILDFQRVSWSEVLVAFVPVLMLAVVPTVSHLLAMTTAALKVFVVVSDHIFELPLHNDFLSELVHVLALKTHVLEDLLLF